jgi:hypothetical protein
VKEHLRFNQFLFDFSEALHADAVAILLLFANQPCSFANDEK